MQLSRPPTQKTTARSETKVVHSCACAPGHCSAGEQATAGAYCGENVKRHLHHPHHLRHCHRRHRYRFRHLHVPCSHPKPAHQHQAVASQMCGRTEAAATDGRAVPTKAAPDFLVEEVSLSPPVSPVSQLPPMAAAPRASAPPPMPKTAGRKGNSCIGLRTSATMAVVTVPLPPQPTTPPARTLGRRGGGKAAVSWPRDGTGLQLPPCSLCVHASDGHRMLSVSTQPTGVVCNKMGRVRAAERLPAEVDMAVMGAAIAAAAAGAAAVVVATSATAAAAVAMAAAAGDLSIVKSARCRRTRTYPRG